MQKKGPLPFRAKCSPTFEPKLPQPNKAIVDVLLVDCDVPAIFFSNCGDVVLICASIFTGQSGNTRFFFFRGFALLTTKFNSNYSAKRQKK
jgi:hypothetical protein